MVECFGAVLRGYRSIYKINKTNLSDIMLCSRVTIDKIEQVNSVSELPDDSLFRVHYFLSVSEEDSFNLRNQLLEEVETEIDGRIKQHKMK